MSKLKSVIFNHDFCTGQLIKYYLNRRMSIWEYPVLVDFDEAKTDSAPDEFTKNCPKLVIDRSKLTDEKYCAEMIDQFKYVDAIFIPSQFRPTFNLPNMLFPHRYHSKVRGLFEKLRENSGHVQGLPLSAHISIEGRAYFPVLYYLPGNYQKSKLQDDLSELGFKSVTLYKHDLPVVGLPNFLASFYYNADTAVGTLYAEHENTAKAMIVEAEVKCEALRKMTNFKMKTAFHRTDIMALESMFVNKEGEEN